ncbi:hypothetical protein ABE10_02520, partial [Bacillus toyonensis]|nr:hypothetical protein [Bacillus toyonensis]
MSASVVAAGDRDDPEDLHVQPDDGDHDAERAHPSVDARGAVAHTLLHLVEVEHERVRRHQHDEDADDEPQRDAGDLHAVQPEAVLHHAGEHEDHVQQREDEIADHRDQEDLGGPLRGADLAAREEREGHADDGEGGQRRLHDDAGPADLEEGRDPTDEEALERGVRPDERRPHLLARGEGDHQCEDEAAEGADDPREDVDRRCVVRVETG